MHFCFGRSVSMRRTGGCLALARLAYVDPRESESRVPYRRPQPSEMRPDLVIAGVLPHDDRVWVPLAEGVWSRPLQFNVTQGQYTHLLRVTEAGIVARHRNSGPVHAFVLRGRWHYIEHDWVAEERSYV